MALQPNGHVAGVFERRAAASGRPGTRRPGGQRKRRSRTRQNGVLGQFAPRPKSGDSTLPRWARCLPSGQVRSAWRGNFRSRFFGPRRSRRHVGTYSGPSAGPRSKVSRPDAAALVRGYRTMISDAQLPVRGQNGACGPCSKLSPKSALRQPSMHKILHAAPY